MINKDTEYFFKDIKHKIELTKKIKLAYSKELALEFNSFNFVKWNENKVSEIIGFFLNPHASHAQGDLYLRLFISYFDLYFPYFDVSKVRIILEESTDDNRRVDIVISYDNFKHVIGIENKIYPWTKDQPNQVQHYLEYLKGYCETGNYKLLYLAPKSKVLNEYSAGPDLKELLSEGKLMIINYEEHIINLVRQFAMNTDNDRIRTFIKDFELKLRHNYLGNNNMNENNDLISYIRESSENLIMAFAVSNNLNTVKANLKDVLIDQMQEVANELNLAFDTKHKHFVLPNIKNLNAKFNFEGGGLIYGLVKTPEFFNENSEKVHLSELAMELKTQFDTSVWWPLHKYLYERIEVNENLWIDIISGKLKSFIKKFLQAVINLPQDITKGL